MKRLVQMLSVRGLGVAGTIGILSLVANSATPFMVPFEQHGLSMWFLFGMLAGLSIVSLVVLALPHTLHLERVLAVVGCSLAFLASTASWFSVFFTIPTLVLLDGFFLGLGLACLLLSWAWFYLNLSGYSMLITLVCAFLLASLVWLLVAVLASPIFTTTCLVACILIQAMLLLLGRREQSVPATPELLRTISSDKTVSPIVPALQATTHENRTAKAEHKQGIFDSLTLRGLFVLMLVYWLDALTFWPVSGELASKNLLLGPIAFLIVASAATIVLLATKSSNQALLKVILGAAIPIGVLLLLASVALDAFFQYYDFGGLQSNPRLGPSLLVVLAYTIVISHPVRANRRQLRLAAIAILCSCAATTLGLILPLLTGDMARTFSLVVILVFFVVSLAMAVFDTVTFVKQIIRPPDTSQRDVLEQRAIQEAERCGLSRRETEILLYLIRGRSSKRIADELFISPETVRTHCKRIYHKMGVHTREDLIDSLEQNLTNIE
jgi:DNA-binding CsgD family transcriptional regulator